MSSTNKNALALTVALLAGLSLVACKPGSGANDTLADGATDRASDGNGSTSVGPGGPPTNAASPSEGNAASQETANAAGNAAATVMVAAQGSHLTDSAGNALYYVDGDTDGSKCTGPCLQAWPPVTISEAQPTGAPGLQGAMIATITRPDGSRQVTFNGHPLYRYAADAGAGVTNGDGVKDKFGLWHLVPAQMDHAAHGAAAKTSGKAGGSTTGG